MGINLIAMAIPAFVGLIGVEYLVSRVRRRELLRLHDSVSDLGCGIGNQIVGLAYKGVLFAAYVWLYDNHALLELPGWAAWALALVGVDFTYYWWHRASHRINAMWAAHIVHHQSEDYNLAVALRQAWFTGTSSWVFDLPLALLGVPPVAYATSAAISLLYQFWIHTQTIDRLGPLEHVLNTPSHHRVHHGTNAAYIDKNYGGILIVWDKLFGTFEPEVEPVSYGTITPLASFNPVWANFDYWAKLARLAVAAPRLRDKLAVWIKPPEWRPEGLPPVRIPTDAELAERPLYAVPSSPAIDLYATVQFVPAIAATTAILFTKDHAPLWVTAVAGTLTVVTVMTATALYEARRWAVPTEAARLAAVMAFTVGLAMQGQVWGWAVATTALASGIWLATVRGRVEITRAAAVSR